MNISREQIDRFFRGECTAAEALAVSDYLENNPGAADDFLPSQEWAESAGNAGKTETYWQEVWQDVQPVPVRRVVPLYRKLAVAALIAGAMAGAWYFMGHKQQPATVFIAEDMRVVFNNGKDILLHLLEDSSSAALQPGSGIRYDPAFANGRRDIYLNGEAVFTTRGNAEMPFSVHVNGMAVTALGTKFKVSAEPGGQATNVVLLEGKVMIKATDTTLARLDQDYILLPGDEFSYSRELGVSLHRKLPATKPAAGGNSRDAAADAARNSWYMFENQGLSQVFDQLSAIYDVRIYYNPADLQGMSFIGKIDQSDSLDNILRDITMLNNLIVTKNKKGFIIKSK
ncbi:FecR family protein [Chitinophaga pollutisoli]|uniref:FecR family protein n=1 Tax=Chitinophaga pollutisoli TaxID=3133966 RepID=A0ABZ2YS93_9BACT